MKRRERIEIVLADRFTDAVSRAARLAAAPLLWEGDQA